MTLLVASCGVSDIQSADTCAQLNDAWEEAGGFSAAVETQNEVIEESEDLIATADDVELCNELLTTARQSVACQESQEMQGTSAMCDQ